MLASSPERLELRAETRERLSIMRSEYHLLHAPNMRELADSLRVRRVIAPETSTSYPTDDVSVSYVRRHAPMFQKPRFSVDK